jgi:hypothetical protein
MYQYCPCRLQLSIPTIPSFTDQLLHSQLQSAVKIAVEPRPRHNAGLQTVNAAGRFHVLFHPLLG